MTRYVAFLRAVNVAGHARVKMTNVRDVFIAAGGTNVTTYLQSGNVLFASPARDSSAVVRHARRDLERILGEAPEIILRTMRRLAGLLEGSPFSGRTLRSDVKLYVVLLSGRPRRNPEFPLVSAAERLQAVGMEGRDVFVVSRRKKNGFFGFPNSFVEEAFGVPATSRNWSTITKLVQRA